MKDTNPQLLQKFTLLAKDIIYNKVRMTKFMSMLSTQAGAVMAVHAVMDAIQTKKEIPPSIAKHLGVICYALIVDMAQEITHQTADPSIMKEVISKIMGHVGNTHPDATGIVNNAMGASA